jgi:beta-lactamase regulating signal transducer with metallopeptidase domain
MSFLHALGWSFIHFLWQGLAIAIACWALLVIARSARMRYAIGCAGLFLMLAAPVGTFIHLSDRPDRGTAISIAPLPLDTPSRVDASAIAATRALPDASSPHLDLQTYAATFIPWIGRAWIAGVLLIAAWHVAGFTQLSRLRRGSAPLDDWEWIARLRHWKDRLSIRRSIALLVSQRVDCPAVVGFFRPVILWPAAALTGLTPTQIDALLVHELSHIRRYDELVNLVQVGVETLLFFHPCVWWLSRRVRQERENCCDDLAASVLGSRVEYAGALIAMESLRQTNVLSLSANGGSLMKRIKRLLDPKTSPRGTRGDHVVLLLIAVACAASIWSSRINAADAGATTKPAEAASTQASADSLRSALANLIAVRGELRTKAPNLSQFSPETIDLQNRSRETMRTFVLEIFAIVETPSWKEQLDAAASSIDENEQAGTPQALSRSEFIELLNETQHEAEVQLGKDSIVASRLAQYVRDSNELLNDAMIQSLSKRDPFFSRLLMERDTAARELARLESTMGKNSPPVKRLSSQLALLQDRLQDMSKAMMEGRSQVKEAEAGVDFTVPLAEARKLEEAIKELEARSKQIAESQQKLIESANQESQLSQLRSLNKERDGIIAAIEAKKASPDSEKAELDQLFGLLTRVNSQLDALSGGIGEYYVGGHVERPGVYSLTARKISMKQAMISAGAADANDETYIQLVRRDPVTRKESFKTVKWGDIRDSAVGDEGGDFFLMPDDQIIVGIKKPTTEPSTKPGT